MSPADQRFQNAKVSRAQWLKLCCSRPQSERKPDIALENSCEKTGLAFASRLIGFSRRGDDARWRWGNASLLNAKLTKSAMTNRHCIRPHRDPVRVDARRAASEAN